MVGIRDVGKGTSRKCNGGDVRGACFGRDSRILGMNFWILELCCLEVSSCVVRLSWDFGDFEGGCLFGFGFMCWGFGKKTNVTYNSLLSIRGI